MWSSSAGHCLAYPEGNLSWSKNAKQRSPSFGIRRPPAGATSSRRALPPDWARPSCRPPGMAHHKRATLTFGGTGIVAAKRAHDLGADVLVLEQNFDIGGKLSHNGGQSSFGGGDPIQERDRVGRPDPEGWLTAPLLPAADMTDDPETLFIDTTDWSVVNDHAVAEYRYNDRGLQRGWADNAAATPQFLSDNHIP